MTHPKEDGFSITHREGVTQPHYIDRGAVALLPCPFCGGTDIHRSEVEGLTCRGCNAQVLGSGSTSDADTWNRRPAPMEAVAWREALLANRDYALEMTQKHGNPIGTDYEQGVADMGHRWFKFAEALAVIPTEGGEGQTPMPCPICDGTGRRTGPPRKCGACDGGGR